MSGKVKLTAEQRYRQATRKTQLIGKRNFRKWMAGELPVLPALDMRGALIREIERAYEAGFADCRAALQQQESE